MGESGQRFSGRVCVCLGVSVCSQIQYQGAGSVIRSQHMFAHRHLA